MCTEARQKTRGKNCNCNDAENAEIEVIVNKQATPRDGLTWLATQAVSNLHADCEEGRAVYKHALAMLAKSEDTARSIGQMVHEAPDHDFSLKWGLLYVLAQTGSEAGADVFLRVAIEPVPAVERHTKCCEGPHDGELLVRTMAIEGLHRLARSNNRHVDYLLKVVEAQPEKALRIEAAKHVLAVDEHRSDEIRSMMPEDLRFVFDLRSMRAEALAVELEAMPERVTHAVPALDSVNSSPKLNMFFR